MKIPMAKVDAAIRYIENFGNADDRRALSEALNADNGRNDRAAIIAIKENIRARKARK